MSLPAPKDVYSNYFVLISRENKANTNLFSIFIDAKNKANTNIFGTFIDAKTPFSSPYDNNNK